MKKRTWARRLLIGAAVLVVALIGVAAAAYYMAGARAFRGKIFSPKETARLQQQAGDKLLGLQNWVQAQSNMAAQATRPRVDTDPATAPAASQTVTLTEDELNAALAYWEEELLRKYGEHIAEPTFALRDGRIILAVTAKAIGRQVSLYVEPKLDDQGLFVLSIDSLTVGRFPIPAGLWSGYTDKVGVQLAGNLEASRAQARLEADGTGNKFANQSAMDRLVLNSLKGKGSDAVLFLPSDLTHLEAKGFPVKVADVRVTDAGLTLTVVPLAAAEQQHLVDRLRAAPGEEPPPPIAGKPGGEGKPAVAAKTPVAPGPG